MFERLPGFRDFYPEDCARRNYLFCRWSEAAERFGFVAYDIPTLEPLALFTEKSGLEIVSQLFNFTDKGGREVALRPELTPSLARLIGSKANSLKRPLKWFNIAENFRYEKQQKGRLRSHYQFNCDIFGEPGPGADAELIAVCLESFRALGLTAEDCVLRLSDRHLWIAYLAAMGHEGDAALGILGIIDKLERNPRSVTLEQLAPYFGEAREDFLAQVETLVSLRSLAEVERFLLAQVSTAQAREAFVARLDEWKVLLATLDAFGLSAYVRLDLGIVRGLAYYTGFVFEIFECDASGLTGRALAGGGRYDHLVEKLGYPAMPAVGFGLGDVTMTDLLLKKGLFPAFTGAPAVYAVIAGDAERPTALADIAALRAAGIAVDYALKPVGFGKQFKTAASSGATCVLIFAADELASGAVKVKQLASGEESTVPRSALVETVQAILSSDKQ